MLGIGHRGRLRMLEGLLLAFVALVVLRLFDIQLLQHGHYYALAAAEHQRKYQVPATRGQIYVRDGDTQVPLALDQTLNLMYADPSIISNKTQTAAKLAAVTGDSADNYLQAMSQGGEYVVLKRKLPADLSNKIKALGLHGIGLVPQDYRNYPEGSLASQVLGFVNNDGDGQYGVEGYLNTELKGRPGTLNAKTDTNGVPIATADNINTPPVDGTSIILTLDRNIQAQAEKFIKDGVDSVHAVGGSIIVMDPDTGAIKAMANYPSFDPNNYTATTDYSIFENPIVTWGFEPGSGFKVITMSAGLDTGKITPDSTYNDTGCTQVSNANICNAANHKDGPNTTMTVVLRDSLNTGVMYILRLLGDNPDQITPKGKSILHSYITDHFGFGKRTGVEQSGEVAGLVNPPTSNDVNYANMTFGQGISVTMLQMTDAVGAIANGGKLYRPYLIDERLKSDGSSSKTQPQVTNSRVVSAQTVSDMKSMMVTTVEHGSGYAAKTPGYQIAGKTGTAQIANPNGPGYLENQNIGTFVGFAPAQDPKFVVMVRINRPKIDGFAEKTTVPVFANMTRWLLQYYAVPPSG